MSKSRKITWENLGENARSQIPKELHPNGSPMAAILGDQLEKRFSGKYQFAREYLFCRERNFRMDFAFPEKKIGIEFDGYRSHGLSKKGFRFGLQRQNIAVLLGWKVLRYTYLDVSKDLPFIMEQVSQLLDSE